MKKILLILTAAAGLWSCSGEDYHIYEDVGSIIYFTNGGYRDLTASYGESPLFEAAAYRSGTLTAGVRVGVELKKSALLAYNLQSGNDCKLLPEDCYTMESALKTLAGDQRSAGFGIGLNADGIRELPAGTYILPIGIFSPDASTGSENDTILLAFKINEP